MVELKKSVFMSLIIAHCSLYIRELVLLKETDGLHTINAISVAG